MRAGTVLKLQSDRAAPPLPDDALLCTVVGDSPTGLPVGRQVQIRRFSQDSGGLALCHLLTEDGALWVREVGDEDAAVRLFERP